MTTTTSPSPGKRVSLLVGFLLFFVAFLVFAFLLVVQKNPVTISDGKDAITDKKIVRYQGNYYFMLATFICGIAMVSYLYMWLGRDTFNVTRYLDWVLTTPLLLVELGILAEAPIQIILEIIGFDILMIGCGFLGEMLLRNHDRKTGALLLWGIGSFFFLLILYDLYIYVFSNSKESSYLTSLGYITVISWSGYALVWLLGPAYRIISSGVEVGCYTFLDVVAKIVFSGILVAAIAQNS